MDENGDNTRLLGALLRIPFQAIVTRIDKGLRARGFTDLRPAHFVIFQQFSPDGTRITELADWAQITKQSMGALIEYVESRGYIELAPDPGDRRAKIVRLTPKRPRLREISSRDIEPDGGGMVGTDWA